MGGISAELPGVYDDIHVKANRWAELSNGSISLRAYFSTMNKHVIRWNLGETPDRSAPSMNTELKITLN